MEKFYLMKDVSAKLGVDRGTVHNWITLGYLPRPETKIGNAVVFTAAELKHIVEAAPKIRAAIKEKMSKQAKRLSKARWERERAATAPKLVPAHPAPSAAPSTTKNPYEAKYVETLERYDSVTRLYQEAAATIGELQQQNIWLKSLVASCCDLMDESEKSTSMTFIKERQQIKRVLQWMGEYPRRSSGNGNVAVPNQPTIPQPGRQS
jgi:predicted DNA-binding transcriptional regulator AlpA